MSLRNRIATTYAVSTGVLLSAVAVILYLILARTVQGHLDEDLEAESHEVFNGLVVLNDTLIFADEGEWREAEHARVEVDPVFLAVVDTNGVTLRRSPSLRGADLRFARDLQDKAYVDTDLTGSGIRQAQIPVRNPAGRVLGYVIIAMSNKEADMVLATMRLGLMISIPVILLVVFAISRFIAGRSIAPVQDMMVTAERITSRTLDERVELPATKDELYRLAATINGLLDRLADALRRERQFTADASHELRTPLASIRGTLEVLIRKPRTREQYEEKSRYCIQEVDRITHLVDQLLLLARADSAAAVPLFTSVDPAAVVDGVIDRIRPTLEARGGTITVSRTPAGLVKADAGMMDVILENILGNAVKYALDAPAIEVSIAPSGGGTVVTVADNGPGIPPDQLAHIFDRFYRVDAARTSAVEGTGLGLALVKRLADIQGIRIEVTSTLERGTRFTLHLPPWPASTS